MLKHWSALPGWRDRFTPNDLTAKRWKRTKVDKKTFKKVCPHCGVKRIGLFFNWVIRKNGEEYPQSRCIPCLKR